MINNWPCPVDYNWRGERLQIAHEGQLVELKPMGPNSWARCVATINAIDETAQTVELFDDHRTLTITFEDWCWMQASPLLEPELQRRATARERVECWRRRARELA
jgi:hypothetical protein